ncbi:MAG: hypothetical protein ACRDRO_03440 [Pseudonocardiaceae bacterium]
MPTDLLVLNGRVTVELVVTVGHRGRAGQPRHNRLAAPRRHAAVSGSADHLIEQLVPFDAGRPGKGCTPAKIADSSLTVPSGSMIRECSPPTCRVA